MFGLAGPVRTPEGRCLTLGKIQKQFLCLEVMGLETDEVNELQ